MGMLVDGKWHEYGYDIDKTDGEFIREQSKFRRFIVVRPNHESVEDVLAHQTDKNIPEKTNDDLAEEIEPDFIAEPGRYHLYVSYGCPWSHRVLIYRELKDLQRMVSVSVLEPRMMEKGWEFQFIARNRPHCTGATADALFSKKYLYEIYQRSQKTYTGRVTVPVLWDKRTNQIVNNESADIIRMFNSVFNDFTKNHIDFYPSSLRKEIDSMNTWIYEKINNGVYLCGFASAQESYNLAVTELFEALDRVDEILSTNRYLMGDQLTEPDWRLFVTLIRFDSVYFSLFKANRKRIEEYSNISGYLRELYQLKHIASTVFFEHIKEHYYHNHPQVNPHRIIPADYRIDYSSPHYRS